MTYSVLAARGVIGSAALAVFALAALHILKPDVHPSRTMISQYALGRHGWVMALCVRGVRRSLCLPVRGAHRECADAPRTHRLGLPAGRSRRTDGGRRLSDGPGFGAASADVFFRKDAQRVVLDWRAEPSPRGAPPVSRAPHAGLLRDAAAPAAHRASLAQPRQHDHHHVDRGSREAAKPQRTGKISWLAQPVVHGRLRRVADRRRVADGSLTSRLRTI
jgi:hypothetical protein